MPALLDEFASGRSAYSDRAPLELRCYVYPVSSGVFQAECIDLDLFARGESASNAKESLGQAIGGYFKTALAGDPIGLIPRPSPLSRKLRYYAFHLYQRLGRTTNDLKTFKVQLKGGSICMC
jgi:hypothetical protein